MKQAGGPEVARTACSSAQQDDPGCCRPQRSHQARTRRGPGGPRSETGLSRRLDGASCRFPAARWSIEPAGCAAPNHAGSGQDRSSAPGAPLSTRAHSRHPPSPSRLKTLELTAAHLAAVLGVRMSVRTVEVDVGMAGRFADECQRQAAHQ
jgi:hypothetical protein